MANAMMKSIESPIDKDNIVQTSKNMSWDNYAKAILNRPYAN